MILISGAQRDLGMTPKSITQSSDWIGSYLIAKSQSTFNSESNEGAKFFLGAIFAPKNLVASPLDSEFNVDYDFAIKYDPIQSDDWDIDFGVMPKSRWAPKIMIIP